MRHNLTKMYTHNGGFTMIELLVVIAIMAILSTTGFLFLGNFSANNNLKKVLSEVEAVVTATQKRSITQDTGKRWNVRFINSVSSGNQFIVFSGLSYATSAIDRTYALAHNVQFSEPSVGNSFDALFAPITGALPSRKIISMVTGRGDGFVGDLILNTSGLVTKRSESGLVGYWHFDEGVGTTTFDAAGMRNNGAITIGATGSQTNVAQAWTNGTPSVAGNALNFDGTDDYVFINDSSSLDLTSSFTFAMWIYPVSYPTEGMILNKESTYELATSPSGTIKWAINNTTPKWTWVDTGLTVPLNQWTHIAVTYNGSSIITYKNGGAQISTTAGAGNIIPNANPVTIAARSGGTTSFFAGKLDEVRIYNRALSAAEVATMYSDLK